MVYSLLYRRPSLVSSRASTISSSSTWSQEKPHFNDAHNAYLPNGVPEALSLDRILAGKTCKPCSVRDFMNYLVYIEHSAENLQFFLWYRDYVARFARLPASEKALSSLWVDEKFDDDMVKPSPRFVVDSRPSTSDKNLEALPGVLEIDADSTTSGDGDPFHDRPTSTRRTATSTSERTTTPYNWDEDKATWSTRRSDFREIAAGAYESLSIMQPFTVQPYREEITRIIATYIADDSPRQLNLASKERAGLLYALASTTHPSALSRVAATIETSLRRQSHPNFVRFCICNGDKPRVTFAQGLGVAGILAGLAVGLVLCLSGRARPWRLLSAIPMLIGITTLILGVRGLCVVLNVFHHCHMQPWELFVEEPDSASTYDLKHNSFDSFGSANSFEDEPWVSKYEKLNVLRRVFSREERVNEPALRLLHETMLLQALLGALGGTLLLEAVLLAVPAGNLF